MSKKVNNNYSNILELDKKVKEYINIAKTNNRIWVLDDNTAYKMLSSNCHYCGQKSNTNNIDLIDKTKDFTIDNVNPCCDLCSKFRYILDLDTFIKRCIHIATYNSLYAGKLYPESFDNIRYTDYDRFMNTNYNKSVTCDITESEYLNITSKNCYICGRNERGYSGIAMIDNRLGYVSNNVKPCCFNCDKTKGRYNIKDYTDKCKLIAERSNIIRTSYVNGKGNGMSIKDMIVRDDDNNTSSDDDIVIKLDNIKTNKTETNNKPLYVNKIKTYNNSYKSNSNHKTKVYQSFGDVVKHTN